MQDRALKVITTDDSETLNDSASVRKNVGSVMTGHLELADAHTHSFQIFLIDVNPKLQYPCGTGEKHLVSVKLIRAKI